MKKVNVNDLPEVDLSTYKKGVKSIKKIVKYPGGTSAVKPKTAKQLSAESKKARAAASTAKGNIANTTNQTAIDATKNEYGLPVGEQQVAPQKVTPQIQPAPQQAEIPAAELGPPKDPNSPKKRGPRWHSTDGENWEYQVDYKNGVKKLKDGDGSLSPRQMKIQKRVSTKKDKYGTDDKGVYRNTKVLGKVRVKGDEANEVFQAGILTKTTPAKTTPTESPLGKNPMADRGNIKPGGMTTPAPDVAVAKVEKPKIAVSSSPNYDSMTFGKAFAEARKSGGKEFNWNGKKYTTQTKEEANTLAVKKAPAKTAVAAKTTPAPKVAAVATPKVEKIVATKKPIVAESTGIVKTLKPAKEIKKDDDILGGIASLFKKGTKKMKKC